MKIFFFLIMFFIIFILAFSLFMAKASNTNQSQISGGIAHRQNYYDPIYAPSVAGYIPSPRCFYERKRINDKLQRVRMCTDE